ncbi:MAG: SurA N-terminal domain-containing protein [Alphaproteobacteria bacterium]
MLDLLRKSAASWVAKILFAILVLSFAVWGIGDIFRRPGREVTVAHVGSQIISARAFMAEFQRYLEQMRPVFGGNLDAEKARELGFVNAVLQRMLGQALFDEAGHELGIAVSDRIVRDTIKADPTFKGAGGGFDEFTFRQALLRAGYSEGAFVEAMRRDIVRSEVTGSVREGAWPPQTMTDLLYRYRMEKRVAQFVEIQDSAITEVGEPDDAALAAYYKEHDKDFMAPEYRRLTVVAFGPSDLAKEIEIPEDDIRQAYDENKARYETPERRTVEQMVLADEDTAKKAEALLAQGTDFAAVAKEVTGKDDAVVTLSQVTRTQLPAELRDPAFTLAQGSASAPVKTVFGWHILKVTTIEPGTSKSFEEARDELRNQLALDKARDALYTLSTKLEDELAGGAKLEDAAAKLGLKVTAVDAVDERGNDASGHKIAGLSGGPLLATAFKTAEGDTSQLTDAGEAGYFIVRVDKITPSAVRPLDKIRDVVASVWKANERKKLAATRADEIAAAVKGGKTLADAASKYGLTVKTTEPFLRTGSQSLPASVVAELFQAKVGGAAAGESDTGSVAAVLTEVKAADPAADKDGVEGLTATLRNAIGTDLLVQYGAALEQRYSVRIDQKALDGLFSSP